MAGLSVWEAVAALLMVPISLVFVWQLRAWLSQRRVHALLTQVLVAAPDPSAMQAALEQTAADDPWLVRTRAALRERLTRDCGTRELVEALLHSPHQKEREDAVRELGRLQNALSVRYLTLALCDPAPAVKAAAISALGEHPAREAAEVLWQQLLSKDAVARRAVEAVLRKGYERGLTPAPSDPGLHSIDPLGATAELVVGLFSNLPTVLRMCVLNPPDDRRIATAVDEFADDRAAERLLEQAGRRGRPEALETRGRPPAPDPSVVDAPATSRGTGGPQGWTRADNVDVSLYAPAQARPGDAELVQAFVHRPRQAPETARAAQESDDDTARRGVARLGARIRRRSTLIFELSMPRLGVREAVKAVIWEGKTRAVQFVVQVPARARPRAVVGTLLVRQDAVPIGEISFRLDIVAKRSTAAAEPASCGEARRFEKAFVSYASEDRAEVLKRVQLLPRAGVQVYQDLITMEPGDEWWPKICAWIDDCDVFLLFWSTAAKRSEWVRREWEYAVAQGRANSIHPVPIEGPPIPAPPSELAHLHFGDRMLYLLRASA